MEIAQAAKLLRYFSLKITTEAGSGHPTSCLSSADLMAVLFFGGFFRYDIENPKDLHNDRLIFSKGHASALLYSMWKVAGGITKEELFGYREFDSKLEGHPTPEFKFADVATGSLGQGLSIGCGMAMSAKMDESDFKTYVLLGDSEFAEGSNYEALEFANYNNLKSLVGILDVNRLGQRGETMFGWDLEKYQRIINSFGWETKIIDGHSITEIKEAFDEARFSEKPFMIVAKTIKGKGVSFLENQDGWHGKSLKSEDLLKALNEIGTVDENMLIPLEKPSSHSTRKQSVSKEIKNQNYSKTDKIATREAYGNAISRIFPKFENIISLDGEVSNSTRSDVFKKNYPNNFVECFIAEQNMVGVALGLSKLDKIPFVSTFSSFFTRAFDQIRMAAYSQGNMKFVGSHAGVSIGQDGPSQMGLEDIAMFRSVFGSTVLYPSDAVSADKLVEKAAEKNGIFYIRTTRMETPIIYDQDEEFEIGGSKTLKSSEEDKVAIVACGVTLHEALKAYQELLKENILARVIDLYSIKPIDENVLLKASEETSAILVVEDHYQAGGIGEAVISSLSQTKFPIYSLCVRKLPRSGKPEELLDFEEISSRGIANKVKEIIK